MGTLYSIVYEKIFGVQELNCIMLGLDYSSLDEIFNQIMFNGKLLYLPFDNKFIEYKQLKINYFGLNLFRNPDNILKYYFKNAYGLIFVIDSSDINQIDKSIIEFNKLLKNELLQDSIFLIFADNQDHPKAIDIKELSKKMKLDQIADKEIKIFGIKSEKSFGLREGLDWLEESIVKKFK